MRRGVVMAALTAAVLALTGCGPSGGSAGSGASTGQPLTGQQQLQAIPQLSVTFSTPSGFTATTAFEVAVPLAAGGQTRWLVPPGANAGLDVIGITTYKLDRDSGPESDSALMSRVDGYAHAVHASQATTPKPTTVGGQRAWTQSIAQPGGPKGPFTYDATYVFDSWYLVQVMCQYDLRRAAIQTGCQTVVNSMKVAIG